MNPYESPSSPPARKRSTRQRALQLLFGINIACLLGHGGWTLLKHYSGYGVDFHAASLTTLAIFFVGCGLLIGATTLVPND